MDETAKWLARSAWPGEPSQSAIGKADPLIFPSLHLVESGNAVNRDESYQGSGFCSVVACHVMLQDMIPPQSCSNSSSVGLPKPP